MGRQIYAAIAIAIALPGCTSTRQIADIGFQPPAGSYRLIVMRPDISVGLLSAGGTVERRDEWSDQARANVLSALAAQQALHGGSVTIAAKRGDTGADPAAVADLERLHEAVGAAIRTHKYTGLKLPTKVNLFDWTLGEPAAAFGKTTGYDYALFLHAEDSFSSSGRVALQAVAFMGCMVGVCLMPPGSQQAAYASLVDLRTGKIVWFNTLNSTVGDIRTPDGATKMVAGLLDKMKPGSEIRTKARKAA